MASTISRQSAARLRAAKALEEILINGLRRPADPVIVTEEHVNQYPKILWLNSAWNLTTFADQGGEGSRWGGPSIEVVPSIMGGEVSVANGETDSCSASSADR